MSDPQHARYERLKKKSLEVVQHYSKPLQPEHASFVDQAWPTSKKRKDPRYIKWKFRSDSSDEIKSILLAVDQQKVVGHLGLIPSEVVMKGKRYDAQWGCNFKVLPGLEGAGFGSLLDLRSLDLKTITLGAAPTQQSEEIKVKLGFKKLEGPRVMVYPIQFIPFVRMKISALPSVLLTLLAHFIKIVFTVVYIRNYIKKQKQSIVRGTFRDVVDAVENFQQTIHIAHILHDASYLQWRCQQVEGYREEAQSLRTATGSFILYYCSSRYCYLHEFYFVNDAEKKNLLKELLQIAMQNKCTALYVYANTQQEENGFRQFGFFGFRRKVSVYVYTQEPSVEFGTQFYMTTYDSDVNL